ncbi:MAG: hypothetical protein JWL77_217, partial [Chthonomonadaceae bacterium]|nr:hypothetical protein [Chthonomonadaceae bacterium]
MDIAIKKPSVGQIALLTTAALTSFVAMRYFSNRKASAAERLTEGLLETTRLQTAVGHLPDASHLALAECAGYLLNVTLRAAPGVGIGRGDDDPIGASRTQTHSFTGTTATVRTESAAPNRTINYAVVIPDVGEVRGIRSIGILEITDFVPAHATPDTVQIVLTGGYTAQIETDLHTAENMIVGKDRVFGSLALHDNQG